MSEPAIAPAATTASGPPAASPGPLPSRSGSGEPPAPSAPDAATNGELGRSGGGLAVAVAGTAGIVGVTALLSSRHERALPANIAENARRRAARAAANADVARRNAPKLAETVLLLSPAAGVGP